MHPKKEYHETFLDINPVSAAFSKGCLVGVGPLVSCPPAASSLAGQREEQSSVSTLQPPLKHSCVIHTAFTTVPKHSPVPATGKKVNSDPAKTSTAPISTSTHTNVGQGKGQDPMELGQCCLAFTLVSWLSLQSLCNSARAPEQRALGVALPQLQLPLEERGSLGSLSVTLRSTIAPLSLLRPPHISLIMRQAGT